MRKLALMFWFACVSSHVSADALVDRETLALQVFKTPTCGCCTLWIDHLEENGFATRFQHPDNINELKASYGIEPRYQSCHTGVSKGGYVFEGHVPAKLVKRFLANPPAEAIGLSVPGMPVGSPGMEVGDKFMEYDVLLLKKDGSAEVYESITRFDQQH